MPVIRPTAPHYSNSNFWLKTSNKAKARSSRFNMSALSTYWHDAVCSWLLARLNRIFENWRHPPLIFKLFTWNVGLHPSVANDLNNSLELRGKSKTVVFLQAFVPKLFLVPFPMEAFPLWSNRRPNPLTYTLSIVFPKDRCSPKLYFSWISAILLSCTSNPIQKYFNLQSLHQSASLITSPKFCKSLSRNIAKTFSNRGITFS